MGSPSEQVDWPSIRQRSLQPSLELKRVGAFVATLPKVAEPEERWNYNSGGSNLLSRLVADLVSDGGDDPATREKVMREFM